MSTLNDILDDDEEIIDQKDLEVLAELTKFNESAESLVELIKTNNYVQSRKAMSRDIFKVVAESFPTIVDKINEKSFTIDETQVNLSKVQIFTDSEVLNKLDSSVATLKTVAEAGLDEVLNYQKEFNDSIKSEITEKLLNTKTKINQSRVFNKDSVMVLDAKENKMIDIAEMPIKDMSDIIVKLDTKADNSRINEILQEMSSIVESNKKLVVFISTGANSTKLLDIVDIYSNYLDDSFITLSTMNKFFDGAGSIYYLDSVGGMVDKVVNYLSFKKDEYQQMLANNNTGLLSSFILDIKEEMTESVNILYYVKNIIKDLPRVTDLMSELVMLLKD